MEHPCDLVKDYTKKDVCDVQFARLEEKIARVERSVDRMGNLMWGQISAVVVAIGTFIVSQLK